MAPERVKELMSSYRANRARLDHLRIESADLLKQINAEARNALANDAIHAQQYTGMPHTGAVNRAVEESALRYTDGYQSPLVKGWMQDHERLMDELYQLERDVGYVDAWLCALDAKERVVIENHKPVGLLSWPELAASSKRLFGEYKSQSGLRNIAREAMKKIYAIAR